MDGEAFAWAIHEDAIKEKDEEIDQLTQERDEARALVVELARTAAPFQGYDSFLSKALTKAKVLIEKYSL